MASPHSAARTPLLTGTITRAMEIATPLAPDVLLFHRMRVREELGTLGHWQATLLSRENIEFDALLGQRVSVRVTLGSDGVREFNGHVTRFSQHGTLGRYHRYTAT